MFSEDDERYMREALSLAEHAQSVGEVPVGAVVVLAGEIIGRGFNQPISTSDPSAHAEIIALRDAAKTVGNYRLPNTTMYVTLEPCAMCAGAIVHARVEKLVYAAADPKTGAAESVFQLLSSDQLNHQVTCQGGLFREQSSLLLQNFFKSRRLG